MGWSVPQVPESEKAARWSPWVCVFILGAGFLVALGWIVLNSPAGGLPSLSSGYYLPLTGYTVTGTLFFLALYLLGWEVQAQAYFNHAWWQHNTWQVWQRHAHEHLCAMKHINLSPEVELICRKAGLVDPVSEDEPALLLFPDEHFSPGIRRFDAICQKLIQSLQADILALPSGTTVEIYIQTQQSVTDQQLGSIMNFWLENHGSYPVKIKPYLQPFTESWNEIVRSSTPVIILALQFYDGMDDIPVAEIATALLLLPPSLLKPAEHQHASRIFRAMPVNTGKLQSELTELRDITQQPTDSLRLVWFSGLSDSLRQKLSVLVHELKLPLHTSAPMSGLLDFDKDNAKYGALSGWLLTGAAVEMVARGQSGQWILCADNDQAWAMVVGNQPPVLRTPPAVMPAEPYPAGSVTLALLFNIVLFWILGTAWPQWLFSGWGFSTIALSLLITLPGSVFMLHQLIERVQEPRFIRAASGQTKE